eukprot:CAMPEP_0194200908 /NCGR_PEP_ID=MMETSP0156-20130528/1342_1 /TAXON_ID=33649 /ORGANISM="Thalassionema nitzschioides, Strain L26-B" /LENGTH=179 /DNA_ID=CAMNT_0038925981 /DNA_START=94 /DNA_END=633 /DNA_ORIENTATION=+
MMEPNNNTFNEFIPQKRSSSKSSFLRTKLEQERESIEQDMTRLNQRRQKVRCQIQQEQLKADAATLGTDVSTRSGCTTERCQACFRKDHIIHRYLDEIQSLRSQLREARMTNATMMNTTPVTRIPESTTNTSSSGPSNAESPQTGEHVERTVEPAMPSFYPPRTLYCDDASIVSEVTLR